MTAGNTGAPAYISTCLDACTVCDPLGTVDTMAVASALNCTLIATEDGNVCAFGVNNHGCLGLGNNEATVGPVLLKHEDVFGGHKVVMVAAGMFASGCVTSDGSLWSWGDNSCHRLGMAHEAPAPPAHAQSIYCRPRRLCQSTHGNSPVTMVAFAACSTYILTAAGDIWSFCPRAPVPLLIDRVHFQGAAIGMIAVGLRHILALSRTGGLVWEWACDEGPETYAGAILTPTLVTQTFGGSEVVFISGGHDFSMAVTADGVLWACGTNTCGECGLDDYQGDDRVPCVFVRVGGAEYFGTGGVHAVSCGSVHTLILAKNHSVWSCGTNELGVLGIASVSDAAEEVQQRSKRPRIVAIEFPDKPELSDDNDVVLVCAGTHSSFVVTSAGLVFFWGRHQNWEQGQHTFLPHQLPDWVMGNAGDTSDDCRAGRWHVCNRDRTMAFMQGVFICASRKTNDTTALPSKRVPAGMTGLPQDVLCDLFENMRLVPREATSRGVRRLMGFEL